METIWKTSIADRFICVVDRIDEYHGQLKVFNTYTHERLLNRSVYLTYGAHPAQECDIEDWLREANIVIDSKRNER